ncbi:rhodanese-like domain-containing protein [Daejeonella sp.]|uniref:rhodanese-like domain-containing protein n=1 Tax=Daejeonella sp. TaxID=2805397 RepID=UPI0025C1B4F2|nr:rhodanese-like domain-containing protein [Daejeonella sp.]
MKDISAVEFIERNSDSSSFTLIDVREELEYLTFNVGGENIPLGKLLRDIDELDYDKEMEIIVLCQRGLRSETAKRVLINNGFTNVRNLIGGLLAIRKLNL